MMIGGGEGGGEWGRADKYGNTITNNNTIIRQEKNKFFARTEYGPLDQKIKKADERTELCRELTLTSSWQRR
jgi:hypothetical protein